MEFILSCLFVFCIFYLPTLKAFAVSKKDTVLNVIFCNTVWFSMAFYLRTPSSPNYSVLEFAAFVIFCTTFILMLESVPKEKMPFKVDKALLK